MTDQISKAKNFAVLHVPGDPLILFNVWDAGSAKAVAGAGAKALATGSWSVADAHGVSDAEGLALDLALANLRRIVAAVDLPVSLDFEGGYAAAPQELAENFSAVVEAGAIGCNFEDQVVGGEGLHSIGDQSARIGAMRRVSADAFINARTDLFLKAGPEAHDAAMVDTAIERAKAYADAGASGFFAPGLMDSSLIATLCEASPLPVNIMMFPGVPAPAALAKCGVARISHGPGPYRVAMSALADAARLAFGE